MPVEIEAKMRVDDHQAIRERLRGAGAAQKKKVAEINIFFDTEDRTLLAADQALRLRVNRDIATGGVTNVITWKGPRQHGPLKSREEIELTVADQADAALLLERLGYRRMFTFAKRRETWTLDGCSVELDELPYLGTFVEIEGRTEADVLRVKAQLHLNDAMPIKASYAAMLMTHLQENGMATREVGFEEEI